MDKPPEMKLVEDAAAAMFSSKAFPCTATGAVRCLDVEDKRTTNARTGERKGWMGYDPRRMCDACAAYWHTECAANILRHQFRSMQIIEAADERAAAEAR